MSLVNETLALWREAERLLDSVAPTSRDHETVAMVVYDLQQVYASLTATSMDTVASIAATHETLASSRALLDDISHKT